MNQMILLTTMATLISGIAYGQDRSKDRREKEREAIIASIASYADAFNAGDAQALAQHWAKDGNWLNKETGELFTGPEAIQQKFEAVFSENAELRISISVESIRFVTKNVAVEEGVAIVTNHDENSETAYTAIHVKENGNWKLDSVRENTLASNQQPSHPELKELEWMIGEWTDNGDESTVETTYKWTKNRNFLTQSFEVLIDGQIDLEGTQVIGWDARRNTIRSWIFDTEGGFGEGTWTRRGDRWEVEIDQTLADGSTTSATNIITFVDKNTCTWQSVRRKINGKSQPDVSEIRVTRKTN